MERIQLLHSYVVVTAFHQRGLDLFHDLLDSQHVL